MSRLRFWGSVRSVAFQAIVEGLEIVGLGLSGI